MNENNKGRSLKAAGRYLYQEGTVYIILVALIIFFSIVNPKFLSSRNLYNLITQSTYIVIAGMGICFVMYLALVEDKAVGCVALTKNDDMYCEIKRLYLKPEYRGMGISKALVETVIKDAKEIGYKHMRLDTFPFMASAIKLYEKYGFHYIERYNDNPAETAIFMQLDL